MEKEAIQSLSSKMIKRSDDKLPVDPQCTAAKADSNQSSVKRVDRGRRRSREHLGTVSQNRLWQARWDINNIARFEL